MKNVDLLHGPIAGSLWRFATPFMLTAFVQMAYTLTDTIWIGRLNSDAVAAVGIVSFLLWLGDATAMIARTGMGVEVARYYGAGRRDKVQQTFNNGFQMGLAIALLFFLVTQLILQPFTYFYHLSDTVNHYAVGYGRWVLIGVICKMMNILYAQSYQSLGNSVTPFRINAIGLVANMVLDPILIFGWGLMPALGVEGAAIATAGAQALVTFLFYRSTRQELQFLAHVRLRVRPHFRLWRQMFRIGAPVAILSGAHAIVSLTLNRFMANFGARPVAAYSIGSQLESISWMTAEGFSGAITAMVAQNVGARNEERVQETVRYSVRVMGLMGVLTLSILVFFRTPLFQFFIPGDPETASLGAQYLLIFGLSQPFLTLEISSAGAFNGLGQTMLPACISTTFNVLRIPAALLLIPLAGMQGIWWGMSLSTMCKGLLNVLLLLFVMHRRWHKHQQI